MKTPFHLTRIAGLLLASSPLVASADAQTVVNGPYYSSPSWDQTLPVASRFLVLSNFANQAVLDRETGLVWQQAPATDNVPYLVAFDRCVSGIIGGRKGWRLPNISEFNSLIDPTVTTGPTFPAGHPFTLPTRSSSSWWSTTQGGAYTTPPPYARYVSGYVNTIGTTTAAVTYLLVETDSNLAWCVRGPGDAGEAN